MMLLRPYRSQKETQHRGNRGELGNNTRWTAQQMGLLAQSA